ANLMPMTTRALLVALLLLYLPWVIAGESQRVSDMPVNSTHPLDHPSRYVAFLLTCAQYRSGDEVIVWLNKIGPKHNPSETYDYYHLPFCKPQLKEDLRHKHDSLGVVLEGSDLIDSGLAIRYLGPFSFSLSLSFSA